MLINNASLIYNNSSMHILVSFLSNPWFIGIIGGVVSSFLVAWVTQFIFSKRDRREYLQKLSAANREVIYAITPSISEGIIPAREIVDHLILATSRKYQVDSELMYSASDTASELIKEVMDSSFISAPTKQEFCEKLSELATVDITKADNQTIKLKESGISKSQASRIMSLMSGLLTSLAAGYAVSIDMDIINDPKLIIILLAPMLVAVLVSIVLVLIRESENSRLSRFSLSVAGVKAEFSRHKKKDNSGIIK